MKNLQSFKKEKVDLRNIVGGGFLPIESSPGGFGNLTYTYHAVAIRLTL